ncbi:MAG: MlaE family ABC transporter permease [Alphaproteobacteria bacterium]
MDATLEHGFDDRRFILRPHGTWVVEEYVRLDDTIQNTIRQVKDVVSDTLVIDLSQVEKLDTAGAYLLVKLEQSWIAEGQEVEWRWKDGSREVLIRRIRDTLTSDAPPLQDRPSSLLVDIGETVINIGKDARHLQRMLGTVMIEIAHSIVRPSLFRPIAIIRQMELTGLRAVPIIILMSFLIGGIVAQQGAFQLRYFGAEIFAVDLVGILALRELSTLLTAIMVAGRSGSAITAELGSMEMREEVDALRVIGLEPVNVLVVPRILALILTLPLLTFISGITALLGGMLTLWIYSGIPPEMFLLRVRDSVDMQIFSSGLIKAPFMALIIGLIACTEGLAVRGSAESLSLHTTASVVKSIFMVIFVDGIFAIFFAAIDF